MSLAEPSGLRLTSRSATYPSNPIAVDLFFANAGHYLKLDNLGEANRIYEDFARKYFSLAAAFITEIKSVRNNQVREAV